MTPSVYRLFYDQLHNDWERVFYIAVEWSVCAIKRELMHPHLPGMTNTSYMRIMEYAYDDHAEFFSFFPIRSEIHIQGAFVYVTLSDRYSLQLQKQYESTLEKVSKGIPESVRLEFQNRRFSLIFQEKPPVFFERIYPPNG